MQVGETSPAGMQKDCTAAHTVPSGTTRVLGGL